MVRRMGGGWRMIVTNVETIDEGGYHFELGDCGYLG